MGLHGNGLGNFHKTLPHDGDGLVKRASFAELAEIAFGLKTNFEEIDCGPVAPGAFDAGVPAIRQGAASLVNPQAGLADELLGPRPDQVSMLPPPSLTSLSSAAEMVELYWMALLRDVPLDRLATDPGAARAVEDLNALFGRAIEEDDEGRLRLGLDLPAAAGHLDIRPQTLFRCGLPDETKGPLVSQFFLHDAPFGTQVVDQTQYPYKAGIDYLTTFDDWLFAQNLGRDRRGNDYGGANGPLFDNTGAVNGAVYETTRRPIATMRDLARFVHKDALHQAYFNAALLLLSWRARLDPGNPYPEEQAVDPGDYSRQIGFGTLGGPHLLTLVSEVANRSLKVVWRQKWQTWLRHRPEAYGGLVELTRLRKGSFGVPGDLFDTRAATEILNHNARLNGAGGATLLLPMAFSTGSPVHPAYGAGHATVAGACVTVLKAWFAGAQRLTDLVAGKRHPVTGKPVEMVQSVATGAPGAYTYSLQAIPEAEAKQLTVAGELNKIACNVAMGRSMGGVHWRSDNTRSLRLGETVANVIMLRQSREWAERNTRGERVRLSYRSFDGDLITICAGTVLRNGVADPYYSGF